MNTNSGYVNKLNTKKNSLHTTVMVAKGWDAHYSVLEQPLTYTSGWGEGLQLFSLHSFCQLPNKGLVYNILQCKQLLRELQEMLYITY